MEKKFFESCRIAFINECVNRGLNPTDAAKFFDYRARFEWGYFTEDHENEI